MVSTILYTSETFIRLRVNHKELNPATRPSNPSLSLTCLKKENVEEHDFQHVDPLPSWQLTFPCLFYLHFLCFGGTAQPGTFLPAHLLCFTTPRWLLEQLFLFNL